MTVGGVPTKGVVVGTWDRVFVAIQAGTRCSPCNRHIPQILGGPYSLTVQHDLRN